MLSRTVAFFEKGLNHLNMRYLCGTDFHALYYCNYDPNTLEVVSGARTGGRKDAGDRRGVKCGVQVGSKRPTIWKHGAVAPIRPSN
jgi:hypothetical protein